MEIAKLAVREKRRAAQASPAGAMEGSPFRA
jgi:hypothetical protein